MMRLIKLNNFYTIDNNKSYMISTKNIVFFICVLGVTLAAPSEDQVSSLQGYIDFSSSFKMYSGYLELQADPLISAHYVFITSQDNPQTDDVVLWSNGGPGCSSLLGFAQQVGPNMMKSGSMNYTSYKNPYSWNQHANMLFFESPPGVGFSINKDQDYVYNQTRTAADSVSALKLWFEKFPEFKSNNFWISGESYCGMYLPYFASALIDANNAGQFFEDGSIRFKGILIGNGVMKTEHNWRRYARDQFYTRHYFYGPEIQKLLSYCKYTDDDQRNPICMQGQQLASQSVEMINPYATIGLCYTPPGQPKLNRRRYWYTPFFEQNNHMMTQNNLEKGGPCTDDVGIETYFNKDSVKKQLNVDSTINWEACNGHIGSNYHKDAQSISIFRKLKDNNLKILLFSGNTDAVVSYIETVQYIKEIGWDQIGDKKPFKNDQGSLLYWKTQYDGLTLVIINGAGHMAPADRPNAAYQMFDKFIRGSSEENVDIVVE